jgi:uncharacterized protein (TIGR02001 family)
MIKRTLTACAALTILFASSGVAAQPDLSWNLALTSDYVFRGVSQSDRDPAVQGGMDLAFGDSGVYVGAWGSSIDYGSDGADVELDAYVGWSHDLSESLNLDLMLTRYNYFGADSGVEDIDYNEVVGVLAWSEVLSLTAAYTNDYANADIESTYLGLGGEWGVGGELSLLAAAGYTSFEGDGDYADWNIGLSRAFGPAKVMVNYHDTDLDDARASDALVLTVSFEG